MEEASPPALELATSSLATVSSQTPVEVTFPSSEVSAFLPPYEEINPEMVMISPQAVA